MCKEGEVLIVYRRQVGGSGESGWVGGEQGRGAKGGGSGEQVHGRYLERKVWGSDNIPGMVGLMDGEGGGEHKVGWGGMGAQRLENQREVRSRGGVTVVEEICV